MRRIAWSIAIVATTSPGGRVLHAQAAPPAIARALPAQSSYIFLGNARSYGRVPGGVLVRADSGAMLV